MSSAYPWWPTTTTANWRMTLCMGQHTYLSFVGLALKEYWFPVTTPEQWNHHTWRTYTHTHTHDGPILGFLFWLGSSHHLLWTGVVFSSRESGILSNISNNLSHLTTRTHVVDTVTHIHKDFSITATQAFSISNTLKPHKLSLLY